MSKKLIKIYSYLLMLLPILLILESYIKLIGTLLTGFFIIIPILIIFLVKDNFYKNLIWYFVLTILFFISTKNNEGMTENHSSHLKSILLLFANIDLYKIPRVKECLKETFLKNIRIIECAIILVIALNMIYIFLGRGYSNLYSQSWGVRAYCGIFSDPHQCAYKCSAILTFSLYLIFIKSKNKTRIFIESLVLFFFILLTGARIPTVLAIFLEILIFYEKFINVKVNIKGVVTKDALIFGVALLIIVIGIVIMCIPLVKETSFYQKFINAINSGDFDNGRGRLRNVDWNYFVQSNWKLKFFGNGADKTIKIHEEYLNTSIWTHNDITQLLISFGIIVTGYYFIKMFSVIIKIDNKFLQCMNYMWLIVLLIVAYENGLYIHPRFVVTINIISMIFEEYQNKNKKIEGES